MVGLGARAGRGHFMRRLLNPPSHSGRGELVRQGHLIADLGGRDSDAGDLAALLRGGGPELDQGAFPRTLCAGGAGLPASGGEAEEQVTACQGMRATPV